MGKNPGTVCGMMIGGGLTEFESEQLAKINNKIFLYFNGYY